MATKTKKRTTKSKRKRSKNPAFSGFVQLLLEDGDVLKPCPFCGSTELELCNTHTPSYWIECVCEAQAHGTYFDPGCKASGYGGKKELTAHKKSKASAIEKWNTRWVE